MAPGPFDDENVDVVMMDDFVVLIVWVIVLTDWWGRRKDRRSGHIPH